MIQSTWKMVLAGLFCSLFLTYCGGSDDGEDPNPTCDPLVDPTCAPTGDPTGGDPGVSSGGEGSGSATEGSLFDEQDIPDETVAPEELSGSFTATVSFSESTCDPEITDALQEGFPIEISFEVILQQDSSIEISLTDPDGTENLQGEVRGRTMIFEEEGTEPVDSECSIDLKERTVITINEDESVTGSSVASFDFQGSSCGSVVNDCEVLLSISSEAAVSPAVNVDPDDEINEKSAGLSLDKVVKAVSHFKFVSPGARPRDEAWGTVKPGPRPKPIEDNVQ